MKVSENFAANDTVSRSRLRRSQIVSIICFDLPEIIRKIASISIGYVACRRERKHPLSSSVNRNEMKVIRSMLEPLRSEIKTRGMEKSISEQKFNSHSSDSGELPSSTLRAREMFDGVIRLISFVSLAWRWKVIR